MDKIDKGLDDLLDMTDTEESSSSSNPGLFETNQPFVLELHELKKDEPGSDTRDSKTKKKKKKKTKPVIENKGHATSSTSSVSDLVPAMADAGKEEFYDANESYHALSAEDSKANPVASVGLAQAHSEDTSEKRSERRFSREPSTVTTSLAPSE